MFFKISQAIQTLAARIAFIEFSELRQTHGKLV
jgi:hypothetical protein